MAGRPLPTEQEVRSWIRERRNWGRWGKDDQRGAMNLVTPEKRVAAARLVKSGRSVSLSRPFPTSPGLNNSLPAQHYMRVIPRGKGAFAGDYYGIFYHGVASTHIDALCHTWDDDRDVERPRPEEGDHLRRRDVRLHRALGRRGHHHPRRHARRDAPPRRPARDAGHARARLGAGRHPDEARDQARAGRRHLRLLRPRRVAGRQSRHAVRAPLRRRPPTRGRGSTSRACPSCATTT